MKTTYCPACGVNVPTEVVVVAGRQVWRCAQCTLVFKGPAVAPPDAASPRPTSAPPTPGPPVAVSATPRPRHPWEEEPPPAAAPAAAPARPVAAVAPAPVAPAPVPGPATAFPRVVIAEDSALLREVVKDALLHYGVSSDARTCPNGEAFLQLMTANLAAGSRVDLVVLDVEMPLLNGYYAAIALRAVERGLGITAPTPIVFFTSLSCDETFRKVLEYCQPARYLNKGTDSAPPRIATRLVQVLASLRRPASPGAPS